MNAKGNYRTYASAMTGRFTWRRAAKFLATVAACAAALGLPSGMLGAEVTTDQLDYSPGATAIITGSGFAPSETVVLQVLHADGTESTGADHDPWSVAADAEGAFTTSWHVCEDDCLGSTLRLTAAGQTSGEAAETFFTDAVFAIRLTNVASVPPGAACVRIVNSVATSQTFLQVGQTYQFTFLLVTNASPTNPAPACLAVLPPVIVFTVGTNFGAIPVFANPLAPGTNVYLSIPFTVPPNACGDTTLTFVCDNLSTRVVQGPLLALTNTVRLAASLNCSNTIPCTGAQAPTITCPAPITRSSSNQCSALVSYPPPAVTGSPTPVVTCVPPSPSTFPVGITTVTCTASNSAGTATCSFTVRVVDSQRPTISCPANTTVPTAPGSCFANVPFLVGGSDNCPGVTVTCVPPSGSPFPKGTNLIVCTARDASSNSTSCAFFVTVVDLEPPFIESCAPPITVSAGANCMAIVPDVTGQVSAVDNCNSNSLSYAQEPAPGTVVGPGVTTITVTVTDAAGNASQCTTDFIVVNAAPIITALTGPIGPLALGSSASVTVAFTDTDINQAHTVVFDWDDSSSDTASLAAGVGTATQTHTYAAAGVYTVNVTVSDPCASTSQEFQFVVIFDPNGGFVTGGGWIQSPAGAYTADPSLTGRANFGFVSMYHQGASIPTGQTEFQFELGDLNFHSTDYEWLVVAGPKAQYKGTGTVNGAGSFRFMLTARDGEANGGGGIDKFRIKIWNDDGVIYDNVVGASDDIDSANPQAIEGGNIVIHK